MWVQVNSAQNLMIAEMWKELYEGEGIPCKIIVDPDQPGVGESASYHILVPKYKDRVVEEIMRKL